MAQKNMVAYWRSREVEKLLEMNPNADARRLMNSYYRLCGLCDTNLHLSNNEHTCNTAYCKRSEEREERWWKRLDAEFQKAYGLRLVYTAWYPRIGTKGEHGSFNEVIHPYFYN